eukprot:gene5674-11452_t
MLEFLGFGTNPSMRGIIPSELGKLTNLRSISMAQMGLTGTIPSSLSSLLSLSYIQLNKNSLS